MSSIKAYRLLKRKWAATAFDGEGSRLQGGRWNSIGMACVYVAESESLSILETLVHLPTRMELHEWSMYELEIEESALLKLDASALPSNWFTTPAPIENAAIGDQWLQSNSSAGLLLPSTIARRDNNIMLNPMHPDFGRIVKTAKEIEFFIDGRL
jgi:RES domain-containing protein